MNVDVRHWPRRAGSVIGIASLAAVLVFEGMSAEEAILRVREVEPKSIQNRAQETFVTRFAESLRGE